MVVEGCRLVRMGAMGRIGGDAHKNGTLKGCKGRSRTRMDSHRTCDLLMCLYGRGVGAEGGKWDVQGTSSHQQMINSLM